MIEAAKEGREWIERQSRRKTNPTRARKAKKQAPNKELEKVPATLKPIPKKRPVKKAASKTHVKAKAEKLPNSIEKTSKNVAKLVKKPKAKLNRTKTMIETIKAADVFLGRTRNDKATSKSPEKTGKETEKLPTPTKDQVPATVKPSPKRTPVKKGAAKTHVKAKPKPLKRTTTMKETLAEAERFLKKPKPKANAKLNRTKTMDETLKAADVFLGRTRNDKATDSPKSPEKAAKETKVKPAKSRLARASTIQQTINAAQNFLDK